MGIIIGKIVSAGAMDEKSVREGIEQWLLWKRSEYTTADRGWGMLDRNTHRVNAINSLLKDLESAAKIGFFPWEVFTKGNQG